MLTNKEISIKYGKPGDITNHVVIDAPFPLYLDWDLTKAVNHIACHKDIAIQFKAALTEILEVYGPDKIHELGIDQFAGCFNMRCKRGYEKQYNDAIAAGNMELAFSFLSTHSWAIAFDLDADRNKLNESSKTARFARSEYKPMIDILYKHGFLSYGREKNYDYMHFEIAS